MAVVDQGYQPYTGARLQPSRNTWVLLVRNLRSALRARSVRLAIVFCWVPAIVGCVMVVLHFLSTRELAPIAKVPELPAGQGLSTLLQTQLWLFASMATLGAGAVAITNDLKDDAFTFFFSKPVTPAQYLGAKFGAASLVAFIVTWLPALLVNVALVALAPGEEAFPRMGLFAATLVASIVIAISLGVFSVAASAASERAALTITTWVAAFVAPAIIANIVADAIGEPWPQYASIPSLLTAVIDGLHRQPTELSITVALLILGGLIALAGAWTWSRVQHGARSL